MLSNEGDEMQNVLTAIQSIHDVCREDKHAFLKDACAYAQQHASGVTCSDEKANILYYPLKVAATLQSKSEQRLFVYAAQGTSALLLTQLVSAASSYCPPSIPRTERKLGFFSTRDVSTPNVSMQQLDAADHSGEDMSLVDAMISTIELRTTVLRGEHAGTTHTAAEDTVFVEHMKALSILMREKRFGLQGQKWLHAFHIALVCCAELKPVGSRGEAQGKDFFPSVLTTVLQRAQTFQIPSAAPSGDDVASLDNAEKGVDDPLADARLCVMLLDTLCKPFKDPRDHVSRDDLLQMQRARVIRLHLMAAYFDEASEGLCKWPPFVNVMTKKVCPCLLNAVMSRDSETYTQALSVLHNIISRHCYLVRSKVIYFVLGVLVPSLECDFTATEKKEEILRFLQRVLKHPPVLAEWFVNFDCHVGAPSIVEILLRRLGKLKVLRSDNSASRKLTRGLYEVFFTAAQSMRALLDLKSDALSEPGTPGSPLVSQLPKDLESSAVMYKMLEQKKKYKEAVALFNEARQHRAAFDKLAEVRGFMDNTSPYAIAHVLMTCEDLNPAEIGKFLSHGDRETQEILNAFIDLHDFSGMAIDEAVRLFMSSFRVCGEAGTVDRTMEAFAEAYCQQNPNAMSKTAACVLAFSIVMLNTDAHSTQVRQKMTQEQYISNLRGTNDGKDFPPQFLTSIYKRVTRQEIKPWRQFPAYILVNQVSAGSQAELRLTENAMELIAKDVRTEKYVTSVHTPAIAGAICDCSWNTFLPAFSFPLEESHEKEFVDACLRGFADCIAVMCGQGRQAELKAFLSALRVFSHLTGLRAMEYKNVRAVALLVTVAHEYPNELLDGWEEIMRCISWIGRTAAAELVADRHKTAEGSPTEFPDIVAPAKRIHVDDDDSSTPFGNGSLNTSFATAATAAATPANGGGGGLSRVASQQRVDFMAAGTIEATGRENATTLFQHISMQTIHNIFTRSDRTLHGGPLLAMVRCLCTVVHQEAVATPPSTFMFRYLIDVAEANFERKLSVWRELWSMVSHQIYLLVTMGRNPAHAVFAFKALRKFTVAQLQDSEINSDAVIMTSLFDMYHSISEKCPFFVVMESVVSTMAQLVRTRASRIGPGWPSVIATLVTCFERLPEVHVRIAVVLHEMSTRYFTKLCAQPDNVAKLFRAWSAVAREDASLEKYALLHIRLVISSLFHADNPKRLERASAIQHRATLAEEHAGPITVGTVLPTIPILNDAVRFLDESTTATSDGSLPHFSLCMLGYGELASLAADFHARQSLTEGAIDALLDATAALRARTKMRPFPQSVGHRTRLAHRGQGQWEQVYSQCVLNLLDVYVNACVLPQSEACEPTPQLPTQAVDSRAAGGKGVPPPSPATKPSILTRHGAGGRTEHGKKVSHPPGSAAAPAAMTHRTPTEVSEMAVSLLEKLVSLLIKQELIIREEEEEDEEDYEENDGDATGEDAQRQAAASSANSLRPPIPLAPVARNPPLAPDLAATAVETAAEVMSVEAEISEPSPALSAATPRDAPPSPLSVESNSLAGEVADPLASPHASQSQGIREDRAAAQRGAANEEGDKNDENVLDEGRRDEVAEVNLNLVERLLDGLCSCADEKIRDLGFLALRKLISSRLECAISATDQSEMTELAVKLNHSLQAFFQEHVVVPCLQPQHYSSRKEGSRANSTSQELETDGTGSRLPSECALRACINYIDLLGMVMHQEVPVNNTSGSEEGLSDLCPLGQLPPLQQRYESLLDDTTTANILQDFRDNYEASSRVLSLEYFSTLHLKDGLSRAAGERVLAMLITLECSVSNVFIEMEGMHDPVTASQLASPTFSLMTASPSRAGFDTTLAHTGFAGSPDAPPGVLTAMASPPVHVEPASPNPATAAGSANRGGGIRSPVQVQVEEFRNFVLNAFLEASRGAKRASTLSAPNASMANQQQLLATRTVVRSFLESLQHAPIPVVCRLMPKYRTELCELIKSCDEEISPILSEIFQRYLSNM